MKKNIAIIIFLVVTILTSCNSYDVPLQNKVSSAKQEIVNIPHTSVKKQTIGNCWIYSTVAMIESMILKASNGETRENFSETHLTYWDFYNKLLPATSPTPREVIDAGSFPKARLLIRKYGLVRDSDFVPEEAKTNISQIQSSAYKAVNESLKNGKLKELHGYDLNSNERKELVKSELNRIFKVDIDEKQKLALSAKDIKVVSFHKGELVSLDEELYEWVSFPFKSVFSASLKIEDLDYSKQISLTDSQARLLKHVKLTLNKGYPAMISWFVDGNGLKDGKFSIKNIQENGVGTNQGGHISVLEDYTVNVVNSATGESLFIGEGEKPQELKQLALESGSLEYFVIKNSWGADKANSSERDGEFGYHRLGLDYLLTWIEDKTTGKPTLPIISLVVPKMY